MGIIWPSEDKCNVEAYLSSVRDIDSDRQVSTIEILRAVAFDHAAIVRIPLTGAGAVGSKPKYAADWVRSAESALGPLARSCRSRGRDRVHTTAWCGGMDQRQRCTEQFGDVLASAPGDRHATAALRPFGRELANRPLIRQGFDHR